MFLKIKTEFHYSTIGQAFCELRLNQHQERKAQDSCSAAHGHHEALCVPEHYVNRFLLSILSCLRALAHLHIFCGISIRNTEQSLSPLRGIWLFLLVYYEYAAVCRHF